MRQRGLPRLPDNFTVTLEGDLRVYVDGCRAILRYETDRIELRLSRRTLSVCGEGLQMESYSQSELCVTGKITSVLLEGAN